MRRRGAVRNVDPVDGLPGGWVCALIMGVHDEYGDFLAVWDGLAGHTGDEQDESARNWVRENVAPEIVRGEYERYCRGE